MNKEPEPDGVVRMSVNGMHLHGIKRQGQWRWLCSPYPEIALKYSGQGDPYECIQHFLDLATRNKPPAEVPPRRSA